MKKVSPYILLCDTMPKKSNIKWRKLYELTRMIGISSIDVEKIMTERNPSSKQVCIADGPPDYCSALYGSVSIKDF